MPKDTPHLSSAQLKQRYDHFTKRLYAVSQLQPSLVPSPLGGWQEVHIGREIRRWIWHLRHWAPNSLIIGFDRLYYRRKTQKLQTSLIWVFLLVLVIAAVGPFLWALLLHGHWLFKAIWATPNAAFDTKIHDQSAEVFYENTRNLGLIVLGVVGVFLAVWRSLIAHKDNKISEKGLTIGRYQDGARMLESNELSVRMAGVFALRDLALSDPEEMYILVLDLLAAFVREKSKVRKPDLSKISRYRIEPEFGTFPADLQSAMEAISYLRKRVKDAEYLELNSAFRLNLRGANLASAMLHETNMSNAVFFATNLSKSNLCGCDLSGAKLVCTNMTDADLDGAVLYSTVFDGVNMTRAFISNTDWERTFWRSNHGQNIVSGIWAHEYDPPLNIVREISSAITLRNTGEADGEFFSRLENIFREQTRADSNSH